MALIPFSFVVEELGVISEEAPLVPADDVQVLLYIVTDLRRIGRLLPDANPFSLSEVVSFPLSIVENDDQLHQALEPGFVRLGIDTSSMSYYDMVEEIAERVEASRTRLDSGETLCLSFVVRAELEETDIDRDAWLTRALAESESEFERDDYGMVGAGEASIEAMLERVEVVAGDESCVICLNELEVGFEAARMPCAHGFHGECIEKWLRQSHYCPICRFEMPTN